MQTEDLRVDCDYIFHSLGTVESSELELILFIELINCSISGEEFIRMLNS